MARRYSGPKFVDASEPMERQKERMGMPRRPINTNRMLMEAELTVHDPRYIPEHGESSEETLMAFQEGLYRDFARGIGRIRGLSGEELDNYVEEKARRVFPKSRRSPEDIWDSYKDDL